MPGQRGGQQVWWKLIHYFTAWETGWRIGGIGYRIWIRGFGRRGREGWMEMKGGFSVIYFLTSFPHTKMPNKVKNTHVKTWHSGSGDANRWKFTVFNVLHLSSLVGEENDALSFDLAGGQMEMGKFNHHKISIGTLRMYLFCPLISLWKNVKVMIIVRNDN